MSDRVLKCFNCGGEGHYARDCPSGRDRGIQTGSKKGLTITEKIDQKELEEMDASIVENQDISHGSVLNLDKSNEVREDSTENMENKEGSEGNMESKEVNEGNTESKEGKEEKHLYVLTAKRAVIWPETVKTVNYL